MALTDIHDSSTDPEARATSDAAARTGCLSNISPELRARQTSLRNVGSRTAREPARSGGGPRPGALRPAAGGPARSATPALDRQGLHRCGEVIGLGPDRRGHTATHPEL